MARKIEHEGHSHLISEIRQDPASEKWVVIANERAYYAGKKAPAAVPHAKGPEKADGCAFCHLELNPQEKDTLVLERGGEWRVRSFPNKFPTFTKVDAAEIKSDGMHRSVEGTGAHEVVVMRGHDDFLVSADKGDIELLMRVFLERYRALSREPAIAMVQIIANNGKGSGASMDHPHAQIFGIPVIPGDELLDLLWASERYYARHSACVYCDIMKEEKKRKERLVYENDDFVVTVPYATRVPHEQWILPKAHANTFGEAEDAAVPALADAFIKAAKAMDGAFGDVPYNYFIYSAPCDDRGIMGTDQKFEHFHWHARIMPRVGIWGGFELATGLEVVTAVPEESARKLKKALIAKK